jgi:hypothetical protein
MQCSKFDSGVLSVYPGLFFGEITNFMIVLFVHRFIFSHYCTCITCLDACLWLNFFFLGMLSALPCFCCYFFIVAFPTVVMFSISKENVEKEIK